MNVYIVVGKGQVKGVSCNSILYSILSCILQTLFNVCKHCKQTLLPNLTFYLIASGFHRTFATGGMPTEDTYSSGHLVLILSELAFVLLVETTDTKYRLDIPVCDLITGLNILLNLTFHQILVSIEHL